MASKVLRLDLGDNGLSSRGAKALAATLLTDDSALETLTLRGNCLADEGAEALGAALPSSRLKELDIGSNQVGGPSSYTLIRPISPVHSVLIFADP